MFQLASERQHEDSCDQFVETPAAAGAAGEVRSRQNSTSSNVRYGVKTGNDLIEQSISALSPS
jgi:hypothetical protein